MRKVAVTGSLSSGKSSVCQFFENLGAYVFDADKAVHNLLSPKTEIGRKITELLGSEVVCNEQFDRNKIAKLVFSNPKALKELEQILHPAVLQVLEKKYKEIKQTTGTYTLFVAEIPLLFEIGAEKFFDTVIFVDAPENVRATRYQQKTKAPDFALRNSRSLPSTIKRAKANYVVDNTKGLEELKTQVKHIYHNLYPVEGASSSYER